jgi:hypothetical protein
LGTRHRGGRVWKGLPGIGQCRQAANAGQKEYDRLKIADFYDRALAGKKVLEKTFDTEILPNKSRAAD